jgi:hypothetical protein
VPRFMLMLRTDENASPGQPPQELFAAMGESAARWTQEGVLLDTAGLQPAATSSRVRLAAGEITTERGPFTDDKESINAYALIKVDSEQDAVARATEFLELHRRFWPEWQGASEVREVFGPTD